jgi:hypothetical protein
MSDLEPAKTGIFARLTEEADSTMIQTVIGENIDNLTLNRGHIITTADIHTNPVNRIETSLHRQGDRLPGAYPTIDYGIADQFYRG